MSYVRRLRRLVRILGRQPLGWQESARAGLGPDDVVQYWLTGIDLPASAPPQVRAQVEAEVALSRRDAETVAAASVPVIASPLGHCYLDVPYADPPADAGPRAQADRHGRLGLRVYAPKTVADSFRWEPAETLGPGRAAQVAGVEAAIWAETISGFDDLSFLLLPRLPGVAHRAWSLRGSVRLGRPPRPPRPARPAVGPGRPHLLPRRHRGLGLAPARPGPRSSSSSKNPPICRSRSTRWTSRIQWQAWPFRSVRRIGLSLPGAM